MPSKERRSFPPRADHDAFGPTLPAPVLLLDTRRCQRPNYIPHRRPADSDRRRWQYAYSVQLSDIHEIVMSVVRAAYPRKRFDFDDVQAQAALCELVWHCSSGHIDDETSPRRRTFR